MSNSLTAANSMPPTIHESFQQSLPHLRLPPREYELANISGNTTRETDPPKVLMPLAATYWTEKADTLLIERSRAHSMNTRLPAIERPFPMHNEADVVRATTLYVLHPINQAINAMYGNIIHCFVEQTNGPVRCDLVWKYSDGRIWHDLAVLEVKRRGILWERDFASAFADAKNIKRKTLEAYKQTVQGQDTTLLTDNAVLLSKQAAAYALEYDTQFVALFDWDSLFLYRFQGLRKEEDTIGDWAYGTWVKDEGPSSFRKALLGLLVRACQVKLAM